MSPENLTAQLKAEARRLGFDLAGATAAVAPPRLGAFQQWLADGFAGEMKYLPRRSAAYEHPKHVLDGVRSLLMLAMSYRTEEPVEPAAGQGLIARYAWGSDYHDLIHERLHALADYHRQLTPAAVVRGVVDTAPLLEREFAELAGLGWVGKNTLLLNRQLGSWFFLAALLTSESAGLRSTCNDRPLRYLPGLHRRMPDRRDRRALSPQRAKVHLLLDDRASASRSRPSSGRRSASGSSDVTSARTSALSTGGRRRLPSLPCGRASIRIRSTWRSCFASTMRPFASGFAAVPSCGPAARAALPGRLRPGQSARPARGPHARRGTSRHGSGRARGMCVALAQYDHSPDEP